MVSDQASWEPQEAPDSPDPSDACPGSRFMDTSYEIAGHLPNLDSEDEFSHKALSQGAKAESQSVFQEFCPLLGPPSQRYHVLFEGLLSI